MSESNRRRENMSEQELNDTYPSVEEQLAILVITNRKYPVPKKPPKPSKSYPHWTCNTWFHRPDAFYLHLQYGMHHYESLIQADYFDWKWAAQKEVYLKVDRTTREMTEMTKEDFDVTRGSRFTERGIIQFYKNGCWE